MSTPAQSALSLINVNRLVMESLPPVRMVVPAVCCSPNLRGNPALEASEQTALAANSHNDFPFGD